MDLGAAGIYVSVPFCAQKCTYCNFRSDVYTRTLRSEYIRFLAEELLAGSRVRANSLYLGGGSPSLLEPADFRHLSNSLAGRNWEEATIEVAPGEATPERIRAWTAAGINRASLGVQSFDTGVARASGRRHDAETVAADIRRLRDAGIRSVSVDLIAGLARQTEVTWRRSLDSAERLGVDHVSVYMLERDDSSRLGRELRAGGRRYGATLVPGEDEVLDFYLLALERLRSVGFERYEISNFARAGHRSLHNLKYWRMEPYFGFGSDAHSFTGRRRWANVPTAGEYVGRMAAGKSPRTATEELDAERLLEDRVMTGLRTRDGIVLKPSEWSALRPAAGRLARRGWLEANEPSMRLTDRGFLFADSAVGELLSALPAGPD